jgi:tryptophanyl-tRNA synthetase
LYKVDFFPEPEAYNFGDSLVKIPGLDGSMKMSKSENDSSAIFLADSPESIRKKVMRAISDAGPTEMNQAKSQPVENLFALMKTMSSPDTYDHFNDLYDHCQIRYGEMKKQLAEDVILFTEPFREKIKELYANPTYLRKVIATGAEKAHNSASKSKRDHWI